MSTGISKEARTKPKTTSTISWVSDKLAAGAARVNGGEFQDVEVAVVKATNHDISQPKEKHVRTLRETLEMSSNNKKVMYMVHALYERLLTPNESWLVVLKTLMVFHKLLKEDGEATLKLQMTRYKEKRKVSEILKLVNFTDKSDKEAWDFSAFVRVYSSYLEERLNVFEAIKFDVDRDGSGSNVRFKSANGTQLLEELPRVQKLLQRMLACVPEGAATDSVVVMTSMQWLLTECFRLYRVISEGVIHLAEQFFEMDRVDASKGLEMYREAINSATQMQTFFNAVQGMAVGQQLQFPQLTPPPEDFLEQMEEYVKGATSRTMTRRFTSTISRNARGSPSSALAVTSEGKPVELKPVVSLESKPVGEKDLLGLESLDLKEVVPETTATPLPSPAAIPAPVPVPVPAAKPVQSDPFGDTVFQTPETGQKGSLLDDWGQTAITGSPLAGSSVAAEQNTSPFDDFFGGGPMVQPPPAQESFPVVQQTVVPAQAQQQPVFPSPHQQQPVFSAPSHQQPVFQAPPQQQHVFSAIPQQQPVFQAPPQQPVYPDPPVGLAPPAMSTSHPAAGANPFGGGFNTSMPLQPPPVVPAAPPPRQSGVPFSGPGALVDPFADLTSIQKKTSFAMPGAPMRQDSFNANPFGGSSQSGAPAAQQSTANNEQSFQSFF